MKNPPAFPTGLKGKCELLYGRYDTAHVPEYDSKEPGMSLRDYFAAAALTGMYAGYQGNAPEPEQVASDAYFIADEMLKEREK